MKVCPSCNARLPDEAPECRACDHEFESGGGEQKKTMMGMPALAEESDGEEDHDQTSQVDPSELADVLEKQDQSGGDREEEASTSPAASGSAGEGEGADHDATRQVDPSTLAESVTPGSGPDSGGDPEGGDQTEEAARAWGLDEETDEGGDDSEDAGATEVVDPDELDFPESFDDDFSIDEASSNSSADGDTRQDGGDAGEEFGTLSGMSVDGSATDEDGETSMQVGGETDDEEDASTQALSPDELAGFDEMDFGGDPDWDESAPESGDGDETAVVDEAAKGDDFQLPKPGADGGETGGPDASGEQPVESGEETGASGSEEDLQEAPPSGVFRSVGESDDEPDEDPETGADSGNLSDTGVTGTGTYQMSNDETDTGSEAPFDSSDDLQMGGVGSGGDTKFPVGDGASEEERVPERDERDAAGSEPVARESGSAGAPGSMDEPETGSGVDPSTGPLGDQSGAKTAESEEEEGDSPFDDISFSDDSLDDAFDDELDEEVDEVAGGGESPDLGGGSTPEGGPSAPGGSPEFEQPETGQQPGGAADRAGGPERPAADREESDRAPVAEQRRSAGDAAAPETTGGAVQPESGGRPSGGSPGEPGGSQSAGRPAAGTPPGESAPTPGDNRAGGGAVSDPGGAPQNPASGPDRSGGPLESDEPVGGGAPGGSNQPAGGASPESGPSGRDPAGAGGGARQPGSPASGGGPAGGADNPAGGPQQRGGGPAGAAQSGAAQSGAGPAGGGTRQPAEPADAPPAEADTGGGQSTEGISVDKMVMLLQRGFGVLAAVAMVVIAIGTVVLGSVPEGGLQIGITLIPVILGLGAIGLTVLPLSNKSRSIGYGATGGLSLVAFAAVLVAGFGGLAIAKLAGGALLLVAAAFPMIGRFVE